MKTKFKNVLMVLALSSSVLFAACKEDDDATVNPDAPTVVSTLPESDASGVERNATITFTFSEDMAPATINESSFSLKQGNNTIAGTMVFAGKTGVFTPTQSLTAGTLYAASIGIAAKSVAGTALAENVEWTFTTGGSTASISPVDLGGAGNYVILAKQR